MNKINRVWSMPNSRTFKIKPIKELILKYNKENQIILDPFANECSIKQYLKYKEYLTNDLDNNYKTNYNLEAQDFLDICGTEETDLLLYDPPYSGRQVSECYKKLGKTVTMSDTNSGYFVKFKKQISRVVKPGGIVISFGWNSNAIGKKYGFEIIEILLVAHGGNHNDTICVVEIKTKEVKP
jgi:hypothetical protein